MAFKLDISKAYDKLEWSFSELMLLKQGFCGDWVSLAMLYVRIVRFTTLFNDEMLGLIVPEYGLRQGDPLSPCLFILCMEGFTALIRKYDTLLAPSWIHGCKIS